MAKGPAVTLKLEYVFYVIGILFLFATIIYFAHEYLFDLSRIAKATILGCFAVTAFFAGAWLQGRDL